MNFLANSDELTREIFGNIGPIAKTLFYILAFTSIGVFAYGIWRRWCLWQIGKDSGETVNWRDRATRLVTRVFFRSTVRSGVRKNNAGRFHSLLFAGFVVLFVGTCLIALEEFSHVFLGDDNANLFHKGVYFVIYEVFLDAFGLLYTVGAAWFLVRMISKGGGDSVAYRTSDHFLITFLFLVGVSGYGIEGLRIIREDTPYPWISFVGNSFAHIFRFCGVNADNVSLVHVIIWWTHALLVFVLIASFPYTRLLHVIVGSWNLSLAGNKAGQMTPVTLEEFEETGKVGIENIQDFSRQQLMSLDACVACGRCTDACPATEAGKPLSPRDVVQDIRRHLNMVGPLIQNARRHSQNELENDALAGLPKLHGDVIQAQTLWSCTTCNACHEVCPLDVSPVNIITDMRRFLIGEGGLRGSPATALQKIQSSGNPWGMPARERFDWAQGLDVPTVKTNPDFEILFWIGCSASYDRRIGKVARAIVRLLDIAGVNYATLGPEERCTGEFARRMGDEFLFQESAEQNIAVLKKYNVKAIVTHCPHCLNSFRQDYPQLGSDYEVVHHSQFLMGLIATGQLNVDRRAQVVTDGSITYHDPCYLARVNGISHEPRDLIQIAAGKQSLKEMNRHGCEASCCGAGGGRMWFDDRPNNRIGRTRVQEALDTRASTVAVACPFCLAMLADGIAANTDQVAVKDISEILVEAMDDEFWIKTPTSKA